MPIITVKAMNVYFELNDVQSSKNTYPPAHIFSAAYTDFPHFGHFDVTGALNGIFFVNFFSCK